MDVFHMCSHMQHMYIHTCIYHTHNEEGEGRREREAGEREFVSSIGVIHNVLHFMPDSEIFLSFTFALILK